MAENDGEGFIGFDKLLTGSEENMKDFRHNNRFRFINHNICNHIEIDEPFFLEIR